MARLQLSIAMGDYDRTRALFDGRVQVDGVDPVYMLLNPEEMFFRAMRSQDFDVAELSFSSYLVKHARGDCPYIAIPVFLSRAFRHTSIYVRKDRIREPRDLDGKRVGLPEYQLTANVWARAILADARFQQRTAHWRSSSKGLAQRYMGCSEARPTPAERMAALKPAMRSLVARGMTHQSRKSERGESSIWS